MDTSGFCLYPDPEGEVDIGGDSYYGFNTIFRNDEITAESGGYQLSDDGSMYEPPEEIQQAPLHEERQKCRDQINELEVRAANLNN